MKNKTTETVKRISNVAVVRGDGTYSQKNVPLVIVENTGNGYIARFRAHSAHRQDYYVCLDYDQAYELILALSAFKKELGFTE